MTKNISGTAPGQYLGYALQPVRLFYHLLKCDSDALVGLEYADDISVHIDDTLEIVEQCKSALKQNPISDWAPDLWKTFSNWAENCEEGAIDAAQTRFYLYVTPVKPCNVANRLSEARSDAEVESIIESVRERLQEIDKVPACAKHLEKFLGTDRKTRNAIIRNFELLNEDDSPLDSLYGRLDATVSPEMRQEACVYGIGKAKELVDNLIREGKSSVISARKFRTHFRAFLLRYDIAQVLKSLSDTPLDDQVENIVSSAPPFIQQLEFIRADAGIKAEAASDYLRTSSDRTNWADRGVIFEDSIKDYDESLKRRFANVKGELEITQSSLDDESFGRLLYHRCCNIGANKIDGRELPVHFLPGSLHDLSNRIEIGWHPDYRRFFEELWP